MCDKRSRARELRSVSLQSREQAPPPEWSPAAGSDGYDVELLHRNQQSARGSWVGLRRSCRAACSRRNFHVRQHKATNTSSLPNAADFRMTPADPIGIPTTPEGHRLFEASVNATIQASKQRLVDIGYTDAQGNVIRPEMGQLPTEELKAPNGRLAKPINPSCRS